MRIISKSFRLFVSVFVLEALIIQQLFNNLLNNFPTKGTGWSKSQSFSSIFVFAPQQNEMKNFYIYQQLYWQDSSFIGDITPNNGLLLFRIFNLCFRSPLSHLQVLDYPGGLELYGKIVHY